MHRCHAAGAVTTTAHILSRHQRHGRQTNTCSEARQKPGTRTIIILFFEVTRRFARRTEAACSNSGFITYSRPDFYVLKPLNIS